MSAGRRYLKFVVQQPTESIDAFGQRTLTWSAVQTVWGDMRSLSGRESQWAMQAAPVATLRIAFPWSKALSSLTARWRLLLGTRVFQVEFADNRSERNAEWVLLCSEVRT